MAYITRMATAKKKHGYGPPYRETELDRAFLQKLIAWISGNGMAPTESELQEEFQLSRYTVRWRIDRLQYFGYITRKKGHGRTIRVVKRPRP